MKDRNVVPAIEGHLGAFAAAPANQSVMFGACSPRSRRTRTLLRLTWSIRRRTDTRVKHTVLSFNASRSFRDEVVVFGLMAGVAEPAVEDEDSISLAQILEN